MNKSIIEVGKESMLSDNHLVKTNSGLVEVKDIKIGDILYNCEGKITDIMKCDERPDAPILGETNTMTNLGKLQQSIDCETPLLHDVLKWHSSNGRDKYSHFEVSYGVAYFSIYDGEDNDDIIWDLSYVALANQKQELIDWLAELV